MKLFDPEDSFIYYYKNDVAKNNYLAFDLISKFLIDESNYIDFHQIHQSFDQKKQFLVYKNGTTYFDHDQNHINIEDSFEYAKRKYTYKLRKPNVVMPRLQQEAIHIKQDSKLKKTLLPLKIEDQFQKGNYTLDDLVLINILEARSSIVIHEVFPSLLEKHKQREKISDNFYKIALIAGVGTISLGYSFIEAHLIGTSSLVAGLNLYSKKKESEGEIKKITRYLNEARTFVYESEDI